MNNTLSSVKFVVENAIRIKINNVKLKELM